MRTHHDAAFSRKRENVKAVTGDLLPLDPTTSLVNAPGQGAPIAPSSISVFDAGPDGSKKHAELVHINVIAKRHIVVDGNLDDWRDVIPQTSAQTVGVSQTEKAYLPFVNWDRQSGGVVTAWLAYDEKCFYFAAKVPRVDGLIRYETRNDDEYFYPEKVSSLGKELPWPEGVRRFSYRKDFDIPSGNGKHNVQILWDNASTATQLRLQSVRVQTLAGR